MQSFRLRWTLISDAAFGRGEGVAGVVDAEVMHDDYGLPYLAGRSLKGLLCEECSAILHALEKQRIGGRWRPAAAALFGYPGSGDKNKSVLHVSDAALPSELREAVRVSIHEDRLVREDVIDSLTAIRRQTAIDPQSGAPKGETLRALRVVLRGTAFEASLVFQKRPYDYDRCTALLAACVKAFRRAGAGRNRGCGALCGRLLNEQGRDVTDELFARFEKEVCS